MKFENEEHIQRYQSRVMELGRSLQVSSSDVWLDKVLERITRNKYYRDFEGVPVNTIINAAKLLPNGFVVPVRGRCNGQPACVPVNMFQTAEQLMNRNKPL